MEFKIYKAGGETVIAWNDGGVRVASPVEIAMWDRIATLEQALRDGEYLFKHLIDPVNDPEEAEWLKRVRSLMGSGA